MILLFLYGFLFSSARMCDLTKTGISLLHKAKIKPSSCSSGFLTPSPEEYLTVNPKSCYIWRHVMLHAVQAQCIHWLLPYSYMRTLLTVTADVLAFSIINL